MSDKLDLLKWEYEMLVNAKVKFMTAYPNSYSTFQYDGRIQEIVNEIKDYFPVEVKGDPIVSKSSALNTEIPF